MNTPKDANRGAYDTSRIEYLDKIRNLFGEYKTNSYKFLGVAKEHSILDVGCGNGDDIAFINSMLGGGPKLFGIDSDTNAILEASHRYKENTPNAIFQVGQVYELPFPNNFFHRVFSERLFQHLDDPHLALSEMLRVTRPNGIVAVLDLDWETLVINSDAVDISRKILTHKLERLTNGRMGRCLSSIFTDVDASDISIMPHAICVDNWNIGDFVFALRDDAEYAMKNDIIDTEEAECWIHDLKTKSAKGKFFASVTGFAVRGKKK